MKANEYYKTNKQYHDILAVIILFLIGLLVFTYLSGDKEHEETTRMIDYHQSEGRELNEVDELLIWKY